MCIFTFSLSKIKYMNINFNGLITKIKQELRTIKSFSILLILLKKYLLLLFLIPLPSMTQSNITNTNKIHIIIIFPLSLNELQKFYVLPTIMLYIISQ